jgi:hypothetical protein
MELKKGTSNKNIEKWRILKFEQNKEKKKLGVGGGGCN